MKFFAVILIFMFANDAYGLDNGLALTPPMGWLTWERYRCITNCETHPDECISEKLILKMADLLVSEGYLAAGYEYLGIDDCWLEMKRDDDGKLVPNKERFPRGMKFIGDYIHNKGLKFGIYQDFGTKTCAGYPGILGHLETDAKTFVEWGADYVKLDGCNVDISLMDDGYPEFGMHLNNTGRPILYSCSWPVYQEYEGMKPNFTSIMKHCNMWRNFDDIDDSWESVTSIMEYFGNRSRTLAKYAGPGHWNDPDMLIIGNYGLSYDQSKVQMAVWAILAAPLLMSNDLATVKQEYKDILLNKDVLNVNQDPLGKAGIKLMERKKMEVWKREVMPVVNNTPSLVFAFVNYNTDGAPKTSVFGYEELGLSQDTDYDVTDLFTSQVINLKPKGNGNETFSVKVNPTGVQMYKFQIQTLQEISSNIIFKNVHSSVLNRVDIELV